MTRLLSPVLADFGKNAVAFWCPGCKGSHVLSVSGAGAIWGWNQNVDRPTFTPSVLFRTGHHIPSQAGKRCWCDANRERVAQGKEPYGFTCDVCHSFVTDGQIQFLGDCTHALAGQSVDLPEWPSPPSPLVMNVTDDGIELVGSGRVSGDLVVE